MNLCRYFISMLVALCPLGAFAQQAEPTPPPPIQLRIVCLSTAGQLEEIHVATGRGEPVRLRIPSAYLPDPVEYTGPNPVSFWVERPRPEEEGGGTMQVEVSSVAIPEGVEEMLFIFGPNTGTDERPKHRVWVVDFSDSVFPAGSFYLMNATDRTLSGTVGGQAVSMPANGRKVVTPPAVPEGEGGVVETVIGFEGPDRRRSLISTGLFYHATNREIIVFSTLEREPTRIQLSAFNFL